ncbi:HIRAN domain-containing protein [Amycolatopsis alkalitolerans]|uniref:HIRAN domain-containing protein n=1 Tax=Amycolatopsis alkalitolerans TaxID=2547244 RepID=A0A5C4M380_9PSEU|nr:HIRAN domain-containing protein [Amycolatopsis alkalitolerans]TNC27458.1 hypothetical protein FG385_10385 [Amycolatopsis alkalitolerans]
MLFLPNSEGHRPGGSNIVANAQTFVGWHHELMGIVKRLFARKPIEAVAPERGMPPRPLDVKLYGGSYDLEVVGESHYQEALWRVVGGRTTDRVRVEVEAVLVAENDNAYDPNAISVWIDGMKVGYLAREDAESYRPGLLALQAREAMSIGLRGVVVGGGIREDGPGFLGVWMLHDPADFGIAALVPPPAAVLRGSMRTGLTEALLTDEEDDSYDLSWLECLPNDPIAAIGRLRQLLEHDPDPIDRHFMFCELEERLYRSRDAFESALAEYDAACSRHDAEMDGIRDALLAKFGKVPLLETYRQMVIRQQKARNWSAAVWWAERGLALYGQNAARPEATEDLEKRRATYVAKLSAAEKANGPARPAATKPAGKRTDETLRCEGCGSSFVRPTARGRKPRYCPSCR